jgi:hypothetical protein
MYDQDTDYKDLPENDPASSTSTNWWEGPPPAGYTGPWPPPLPEGASYGPNFGQIIYGTPTPVDQLPGATPSTDPTKSPYYHPEYWGNTAPAPTGDAGGGAGTIGGILSPFTGAFTAPTPQYPVVPSGMPYVPPTPDFHPPAYTPPPAFAYDAFVAPTAADALTDPGYEFARSEGQRALEASKAAQGTLNTGGTLKDILAWGNNYATTRYQDVYGRKRDVYDTNRANAVDVYNRNYQTQYADPYQIAYRSALDRFAPQQIAYTTQAGAGQTAYTTQAAAGQRQNELDYRNAWDRFTFDYDKWRDQRDSTFNKTFQYVTA